MCFFDGGPFVHELVCLVGAGGKTHKVAAASVAHHGDVVPGVGAFADCRAGLDAVTGMVEVLEERVIRGGVPFLRDYKFLEAEGMLQVRSDRRDHRPFGLYGGSPGGPSENYLNPDGENRLLPSGITPWPCVDRIAVHRLVLRERHEGHWRHSGV